MASTTLTALEKLESAGFNRTQATAIVATFVQADSEQAGALATKADLQTGLADLRTGLAELRADLYRALWLLAVPLWLLLPGCSPSSRWSPGSKSFDQGKEGGPVWVFRGPPRMDHISWTLRSQGQLTGRGD